MNKLEENKCEYIRNIGCLVVCRHPLNSFSRQCNLDKCMYQAGYKAGAESALNEALERLQLRSHSLGLPDIFDAIKEIKVMIKGGE